MSSPPAPTEAYVESVPELLDALQADPVVVTPSMGLGRTAEVDAALTDLVEGADDAGQPVYVALVGEIAGAGSTASSRGSEAIADELAAGLGEDAWIFVATTDQADPGFLVTPPGQTAVAVLEAYDAAVATGQGIAADPLTYPASAALYAAAVAAEGDPVPSATVETVATTLPWATPAPPGPPVGTAVDEVVAASVFGGVLTAVVVWRVARSAVAVGFTRSAGARSVARSSDDAVGASAGRAVDALAETLASAPDHPRAEDATSCRVLAEQLGGSPDALDRVGALVLARTGQGLLDTGRAYRPCLVNPLHGEARRLTSMRTDDGPAHEVPLCDRCATAASEQDAPDWLLEPGRPWRGPRPYLEGDHVWARTGFGALDDALWQTVWAERRRGR